MFGNRKRNKKLTERLLARDFLVVYRSDHGGWENDATELQALAAFKACVAKGHITPDNGRRLVVRGPDFEVIDDRTDPLPSLATRLALMGEPALPHLVYPQPTQDPALLYPAPQPPGYLPMGDLR